MPTHFHLNSALAPPQSPGRPGSLLSPRSLKSLPLFEAPPEARAGPSRTNPSGTVGPAFHSLPETPEGDFGREWGVLGGLSLAARLPPHGAGISPVCSAPAAALEGSRTLLERRFCMAGVPSSADPELSLTPASAQGTPNPTPRPRTKSPPHGPSALTELGTPLGIARGKRGRELLL